MQRFEVDLHKSNCKRGRWCFIVEIAYHHNVGKIEDIVFGVIMQNLSAVTVAMDNCQWNRNVRIN